MTEYEEDKIEIEKVKANSLYRIAVALERIANRLDDDAKHRNGEPHVEFYK